MRWVKWYLSKGLEITRDYTYTSCAVGNWRDDVNLEKMGFDAAQVCFDYFI
jgi:hypothetical protein